MKKACKDSIIQMEVQSYVVKMIVNKANLRWARRSLGDGNKLKKIHGVAAHRSIEITKPAQQTI